MTDPIHQNQMAPLSKLIDGVLDNSLLLVVGMVPTIVSSTNTMLVNGVL